MFALSFKNTFLIVTKMIENIFLKITEKLYVALYEHIVFMYVLCKINSINVCIQVSHKLSFSFNFK